MKDVYGNTFPIWDRGVKGACDGEESRKNFVITTMTDYETGKTEVINKTNNLVVFRGRSSALARVFGKPLTHGLQGGASVYNDTPNRFICYVGAGKGGAATENNQTPKPINIQEYDLADPIDLSVDEGAPGVNIISNSGRTYHKFDQGYPRFIPETELVEDASIYNLLDESNEISIADTDYKRDSFLIAHVRVTFSAYEANGNGEQEINELGLFFAPDDTVSGAQSWEPLEMYAKVTTPTITKIPTRAFTFNWFIYF